MRDGDDPSSADRLETVEQAIYLAIAVSLAAAGAVLFVHVIVEFLTDTIGDGVPISEALLQLLDGLLLVFIVTELLHTVRAVITEHVLVTEPFLIVGIIAAIRRVVVVTAETSEASPDRVDDLMLEMGLLFAGVVALGVTIFLLRHTRRSEPVPAHEPGDGDRAES